MSSSTPPPGDGPTGDNRPTEPDDTVTFGGYGEPPAPGQVPAPSEPANGKSRTGKVVVLSAAMALLVGGGAFAFYQVDPLGLFRAGPQAAEALPADALVYVGVDLAPSATQKVNALRFLNHFPAFRESVDISDANDDVRQDIFAAGLEATDCNLDYGDDIEPWLGEKFGFALLPSQGGDSGDPEAAFAIEVSDHDKAADGLDKLSACGDDIDDFGYAESGDYVLIAETQDLADGFADDAADESLADSSAFTDDMGSLGELGVATVWVDIAGTSDAILGDVADIGGDALGSDAPDLDFLKDAYQRAAATFRFGSDHVEIAASVYGDTPNIDHGDNEIVDLPDSTVFAMSESGGGARLDASWDSIKEVAESEGVDLDQELAAFEEQTGFSLPDDLETLLGDNLLLALDSEGLTADAINGADPSQFNVGLRLRGDGAKLDDLSDRIFSLIEDTTDTTLPFSKVDFDDGLAIASNDDYADTLADLDGNLGDSDQFQSVTDDAADKEFVVYFNWDLVEDQIIEAMRADGAPQELIDNVVPLRAFGLSVEVDGDYAKSTFRMSVND